MASAYESPLTSRESRRQGPRSRLLSRLNSSGSSGNEQLTSLTGVVLIVLLAVIGVTLLRMHQLIWVHLFVGLALIGPVLLKLMSTGYRFIRYYTHNRHYRLKGPPEAYLRMLAPIVVLSTIVVFVSGVLLLFEGTGSRDSLLPIHKISFIVWGVVTAIHVLGHLAELPRTLGARRRSADLNTDALGGLGRLLSVGGALVGGLVIAVVLIPEFAPWLHAHFHHGPH